MPRRWVALAFVAAFAAGCGARDEPMPAACAGGPATIEQALASAPGRVALPDGTRLSDCVSGARSDADLQEFGTVLTAVAEDLEERAGREPRAALQLGFLVGAARRGAARTNGIHAELARRLERSGAGVAGTEALAQLTRGLRAGRARG